MRDAILNRVSTRTFQERLLTKNEIDFVMNIVDQYQTKKGPFHNSFEFTFNINSKQDKKGKKIGTYGLLKNVPAFIGGVAKNNRESIIDFGYLFEKLILELTSFNYDTCWLGGTFKRKDYRKQLEENEIIPAISPVGFRAQKRSIIDRTIRTAAQSRNRKLESELFFSYQTCKTLEDNVDINIRQSLPLVRRAPSASNKQPWRLYVDNKTVHFYLERTPGYAKPLNYDIQLLDIGIAIAHFEIGAEFLHNKVTYYLEENPKQIEGQEYIITATLK